MTLRRTLQRSLSTTTRGLLQFGSGGVAPPSFTPADLTGLQLWLDASDSSTVLNSISPDTPATDGQTVRRWLDKSGNGLHAEQTTAANQPLLDADGISGARAISFDGVNDELLSTLDVNLSPSSTVFCVVLTTSDSLFNFIYDDLSTSRYLALAQSGSIATGAIGANIGGSATLRVNAVELINPTRDDVYTAISGAPRVVTQELIDFSTWTLSAAGLGIGGRAFGYAVLGWIAEVIIYDNALSEANRNQVESYLASKWGITLP